MPPGRSPRRLRPSVSLVCQSSIYRRLPTLGAAYESHRIQNHRQRRREQSACASFRGRKNRKRACLQPAAKSLPGRNLAFRRPIHQLRYMAERAEQQRSRAWVVGRRENAQSRQAEPAAMPRVLHCARLQRLPLSRDGPLPRGKRLHRRLHRLQRHGRHHRIQPARPHSLVRGPTDAAGHHLHRFGHLPC